MLDRRRFVAGAFAGSALVAAWPAGAWPGGRLAARSARAGALPADLVAALEKSEYVYVSPLKRDGSESRCHGEVWYAWLDDSVVMTVSSDGWKAGAIERGLDRARLWVGDYGRWKGVLGTNDRFRKGPSFEASAERVRDAALVERLLAVYERKYPAEIGRWRDRMRKGNADGSRTLIRYRPVAAK